VTNKTKIILDCDPGHDDALAIMLALASPELEVLGLTTTYGNVGLENTTRNALKIRELCGSSVPVFAGAPLPLVRSRISAEYVHGRSGLDGPALPEPTRPLETTRGVDFIIDTVLTHPGEVTLCPVGPMTNVALAMRLEPKIIPAIKEIVLMGGSTTMGNWSPAAEFNILCDPHAARVLFESGCPITMFGLNVTHQALALPQHIAAIRANGNRTSLVAAELLEFFKLAYQKRYGYEGPALHDPCVIAYLLEPELFKLERMHVAVDTTEGPSFGRTVCDLYHVLGLEPNANVAIKVDADAYFDLIAKRLATLP
jgi:purine nucleosidase